MSSSSCDFILIVVKVQNSSIFEMEIFGKILCPTDRPIFSGDVKKYFVWKDDFQRLIHTIAGDDPYVLKCCLSGKPRELVENLVSWASVWERLEEVYGCKRRFVLAHLNEIFKYKEDLRCEANIINLINKITWAWDQLCYFELKSEIDNLSVLIKVVDVLPAELRKQWARYSRSKLDLTCKDLIEFLKEERWCLEYSMYMNSPNSVDASASESKEESFINLIARCNGDVEKLKNDMTGHKKDMAEVIHNLCDALEVVNSKVNDNHSNIVDDIFVANSDTNDSDQFFWWENT